MVPDRRRLVESLAWPFATLACHALAMLLVVTAMVIGVERHLSIFLESDVDLPSATVLAISLSDYCRNYWYTLLVPLAIDAAMLIGLNWMPKLSWLAWLWSTVWYFGVILLLAFTSFAIALPFETAIRLPR